MNYAAPSELDDITPLQAASTAEARAILIPEDTTVDPIVGTTVDRGGQPR